MVHSARFRHPQVMTSPHSPFQDAPRFQDAQEPPHPLRRFRRSSRDRKLGGVAGGIGRALGIDPVLIRVAFVVLTIFGGSGVGLYALGWLLLPGDRDEVSAGEALIGRGRSSVPAPLAVVLCLVVLGSFTSMFTWGKQLLPIAIIATIVFLAVGRRRGRSGRFHHEDRFGEHLQRFADRAGRWGDDVGQRAERWGDDIGRRAEQWGDDFGRRAERWGTDLGRRMGGRRTEQPAERPADSSASADTKQTPRTAGSPSPFDRPAFWDDAAATGPSPLDLSKPGAGSPAGESATRSPGTEPVDSPADRGTPPVDPFAGPGPTERPSAPAWDPLGAAPFAWDLPEPGPVPPSPQEQSRNRRAKAMGRATFGLALIVGATMALGQSLHWWDVSWAVISASALAVVALGVLIAAFRGRRSNLIGIGIVLSLATGFFTLTGFNGTGGFGDRTWAPQSVADIQQVDGQFRLAGGNAVLDLRQVDIPPGKIVPVDVHVNFGDLKVLLPTDANVTATCHSNAGSMNCLGDQRDGAANEGHQKLTPNANAGTFELTAAIGAGNLVVLND